MSIEVAMATASAREAGLLSAAPMSSIVKNQVGRWRRLDRFATSCAMACQSKQSARLKMLCVDTSVEAHFQMTENRASEILAASEKSSMLADVTVVTSEAAIRAISNGTLSPTEAVESGLVHFDYALPGSVVFNFQQPRSQGGQVGKSSGISRLPMAIFILGLVLAPALVFLTKLPKRARRNRREEDSNIEDKVITNS
jgi:hypothetical protein